MVNEVRVGYLALSWPCVCVCPPDAARLGRVTVSLRWVRGSPRHSPRRATRKNQRRTGPPGRQRMRQRQRRRQNRGLSPAAPVVVHIR